MPDRPRRLRTRATLAALALVCSLALPAHAQSTGRAFSLYLDCRELYCEPDYYRAEVGFVDHVRDPAVADVHLLVTRQATGGGGSTYTLAFYGQRRFEGMSDTLTLSTPQGTTEDERRRALVRTIRLGLARYLARTPEGARAALVLSTDGAPATQPRAAADPWNAWVFRVGTSTEIERETSSSETNIDLDLHADRVTERWKTRIRLGEHYDGETFDVDGERVSSVRRDFGARMMQVRSFGPHWAAGVRGSAASSTFQNEQLAAQLAPALEYDFYPYREATRRQLYVQYAAGVRYFRYADTTVYFKTREALPFESLHLSFEQKQPWGSLEALVSGYHFLHDLGKSRVDFHAGASVRVVQGLQVEFSGRYSVIHDQLYLAKGDLTREEVLLRQTQLATGYRARLYAGVSYTFGSVFNNVVNPRFSIGDDF